MKRKLYFWAKKYVNSENVKLVVLAVPLAFILVQQVLGGEFDWTQFFDVSILITFMLLAVCDGVVTFVQRKVAENTEDSAKLTDEYDKLAKKYKCTNLVRYQGVAYPEECLWLRKGTEEIVIQDNPEKFYGLPTQIAENSKEIMEAHSASTVYNQINIRLDDIEENIDKNELILHTSRTQFFDSLLTNRACDYVFSDRKITIRELYEPGPFLKPLSLSKLSNHLGFNGFVLTSDKKTIPFILRKKNLSIAKNQWATSIGASLKTMYALDYEHDFTMSDDSLGNAIVGEIKDELHIAEDGALNPENVKNSIFAFYRDLVEGGKPQFLFCLQLKDITEDKLRKLIEKGKNSKPDKNDVTTDGDKVCFFSVEQLRNATYCVDKMVVEGKEYKMMPSSVVSVVLLLQYLDRVESKK